MRPAALPAYPSGARQSPANLAFSALLFSFLGWAILESWCLQAGAGALPRLVIAAACAPVLACSLHRFHAACPRHMRARTRPRGAFKAAGQALALLFAIGAGFGIAAASGAVSMVVLPAALCCLTPWTRLRVHQQHLGLSFLAVAAGCALAPVLAGPPTALVQALSAAWCLWAAASALCIVLCGRELLKRRNGR